MIELNYCFVYYYLGFSPFFRYIGGKIRHHKLYGIVRFREGGGNDIVRFREGAEAKFREGAEARFRGGAEVYCNALSFPYRLVSQPTKVKRVVIR